MEINWLSGEPLYKWLRRTDTCYSNYNTISVINQSLDWM